MQSIELASAKIGDITSVIDGIAFQTNILALNARWKRHVPGARPWVRGRCGKYVTASRSAQAAKEIKSLIDSTTESVATGSRFVHLAGDSMDEIRASVGSVSGIMREISIATREQMKGIQEINHAVTHRIAWCSRTPSLLYSLLRRPARCKAAGDLAETAGHFRI